MFMWCMPMVQVRFVMYLWCVCMSVVCSMCVVCICGVWYLCDVCALCVGCSVNMLEMVYVCGIVFMWHVW